MTPIKAMKQALEALEETTALCTNYESVEEPDGYQFTEAKTVIPMGNAAITDLRTTIADMEKAESVDMDPDGEVRNLSPNKEAREIRYAHFDKGCLPPVGTKLYSAEKVAKLKYQCEDYMWQAINLGKLLESMTVERDAIRAVVSYQTKNEGLWFDAKFISEQYLQDALRELHRAIDSAKGDSNAKDVH